MYFADKAKKEKKEKSQIRILWTQKFLHLAVVLENINQFGYIAVAIVSSVLFSDASRTYGQI
jgi:hypothetical protein